MKGVVLSGAYEVEVRDEPYPKILEDGDVILRVHLAGLCGSDLHYYRAHGGVASPFIMGHEAVGDVVEVGSGVKRFKVGDLVVSSFSLSCGSCFYCKKGYTARCVSAVCMGNPTYPGCQAEFVRVAMADSSMFPLPSDLPKELGLMLADILPTGFSVAYNAKRLADEERELLSQQGGSKEGVVVVIGCGPVGLCAISAAKTLFSQVFATDLQASRLPAAEKHGAIALPLDQLIPAVLEATGGRGADAVLELVGHESALVTALDLVRPYGVVSVGGMHGRPVTIDGALLYNKNIRMQFGRCSVQSFFSKALALLRDNQELFSSFIENYIELDEAPKYYELFEQNKVAKTAFVGYKPE